MPFLCFFFRTSKYFYGFYGQVILDRILRTVGNPGLDILRHYADIRRQQHSAGRRVIVLANEAAPVISSRSAGINIAPGFSIVVLANDAAPGISSRRRAGF